MIKAVLFDLGGTLHVSDSPPGRDVWFAQRLARRLEDYGILLGTPPEELAPRLHRNAEDYKRAAEETMRELPPGEIWSRWYLRDWGVSRERLEPIAEELSFLWEYERMRVLRRPGLAETLEVLRGMGLRMGVVSNIITTSLVPHFLAEYGVSGYMDCVVLSAVTGVRKPSPEIFRVAEKAMGLPPEALAYVGDTLSRDVLGTRNAGWRLAIQIRNPGTAHRDRGMEGSGVAPDHLIESLAEIPAIIQRENGSL